MFECFKSKHYSVIMGNLFNSVLYNITVQNKKSKVVTLGVICKSWSFPPCVIQEELTWKWADAAHVSVKAELLQGYYFCFLVWSITILYGLYCCFWDHLGCSGEITLSAITTQNIDLNFNPFLLTTTTKLMTKTLLITSTLSTKFDEILLQSELVVGVMITRSLGNSCQCLFDVPLHHGGEQLDSWVQSLYISAVTWHVIIRPSLSSRNNESYSSFSHWKIHGYTNSWSPRMLFTITEKLLCPLTWSIDIALTLLKITPQTMLLCQNLNTNFTFCLFKTNQKNIKI